MWTYGAIETWDADGPGGGEGAPQTSGVVAAIGAGEGSIGYADASQIGDLPAASIQVGDEWVAYSPEAAAALVDVSERLPGRGEFDFSYALTRDTTEAGVYPLALVSYHIVCLQYDSQEKVDLVKAFMAYVGSQKARTLPLPRPVRRRCLPMSRLKSKRPSTRSASLPDDVADRVALT